MLVNKTFKRLYVLFGLQAGRSDELWIVAIRKFIFEIQNVSDTPGHSRAKVFARSHPRTTTVPLVMYSQQ